MKKITSIALVLILALLLPCFAACNESGDTTTTTPSATTPADVTTPAPADTTADPNAPVTNVDGSCRHAKMNDWVNTGKYTCTGLAVMTRSCKHCDFVQTEYEDDSTGNTGEHTFGDDVLCSFPGSANTAAFEIKTCSFCQEDVKIEKDATNTRKNLFFVAEGAAAVKAAINAGTSNVKYKSSGGWGRKGFTAIHGMASLLDGDRDATYTNASGDILYWNIKDMDTRYDPDAVEGDGNKYCALIGYEILSPITVSGFSIFLNVGADITFDLLGGKINDDGTITWTVLGSVDDSGKYLTYNEATGFYYADFDEITVDCIQLGIVSATQNAIYISELEIYGN